MQVCTCVLTGGAWNLGLVVVVVGPQEVVYTIQWAGKGERRPSPDGSPKSSRFVAQHCEREVLMNEHHRRPSSRPPPCASICQDDTASTDKWCEVCTTGPGRRTQQRCGGLNLINGRCAGASPRGHIVLIPGRRGQAGGTYGHRPLCSTCSLPSQPLRTFDALLFELQHQFLACHDDPTRQTRPGVSSLDISMGVETLETTRTRLAMGAHR